MKLLLAVSMLAVLTPQNQIMMQGVSSTTTGIVRIDPWTCYPQGPPGPTPTMADVRRLEHTCPKRIEISQDVDPKIPICRSTPTGQTCKTIGELFPSK